MMGLIHSGGHMVVMDKFLTTIHLLEELLGKKPYTKCTIRSNRIGILNLPKDNK